MPAVSTIDLNDAYGETRRLADIAGVRLPERDTLAADLSADIDAPWWRGAADKQLARAAMDHALGCVASIEKNLIEARLRLDDFVTDGREESRVLSQAMGPNPETMVQRPPACAGEEIAGVRAEMNAVDFFRAIAGAFDCVGGAVVFAVGLQTSIVRADFRCIEDQRALRGANQAQLSAVAAIKQARDGGTSGWYAWTDGMRNVTLHRARRLQVHMFNAPNEYAGLVDAYSVPVALLRPDRHLPREPRDDDFSAIAAADPLGTALAEDAETTLRGVLDATLACVRSIASTLSALWVQRRGNPSLIAQPLTAQFPAASTPAPTPFAGFTGQGALEGTHIFVSPENVDRVARAKGIR